MNNIFTKTKTFITTHKKTSIAIGILVIIGGYYVYKNLTSTAGDTTYVLGTVQKSTIVSSITGSGQVAANRTLDLKPQVSGNIVYVGVKEGQIVHAGDVIAELDATLAQKSVRDAQSNLDGAKLALEKIKQPADSLSILQAQNAVVSAKSNLDTAYNNGLNNVSNTFLDLPIVIAGIDSTLHGTDIPNITNGQENYQYYTDNSRRFETATQKGRADQYSIDADKKYLAAKTAYDKNFSDYKNAIRSSDPSVIQSILDETYTTSKLVSDAVQSGQNLIQYYQDVINASQFTPVAKSTTHLATLSGFTTKINTDIGDLLSSKNTIAADILAVPESDVSLQKIQSGADPIDLSSAQLSVTKAENSLQDAKDNLANYYIHAPFGGTVAKLDVKVGDPAGSGTTIATLIANEQVVDIPLNEVDVAKAKVGDKTTLTFDAVPNLTLTGKVASIDTIGTVTSGVVNYTVTINFDTTDPSVKPGMSTTASIITLVHADVLTVPSAAVKNSSNGSYVQAFDATTLADGSDATAGTTGTGSNSITSATPPGQIPVTIGISDDTNTEIISGLTEGQKIVIRSIAPKTTTATSAPSILGATGAGGRGGATGGAIRTTTGGGAARPAGN